MTPLLLLALAAPPTGDDPLPPHAVARLGPQQFHNDGTIGAIAVHPDGRRVTTSGLGGTAVWDTTAGRVLARYPAGTCRA
jgi:hypothetical protein